MGMVLCCNAGLALEPVSGALAAGNVVVVKPSELAPSTAAFLAANIPRYLDPKAVKVILGGPEVGEQLMEHRWDKVLFTGNNKLENSPSFFTKAVTTNKIPSNYCHVVQEVPM